MYIYRLLHDNCSNCILFCLEFLFFHYPEAQIYGGYAMAQGAIAIIIVFVFANVRIFA